MISLPSRSGIASTSAMCIPQTGSRTNRREVMCVSGAGAVYGPPAGAGRGCFIVAPAAYRSIHTTIFFSNAAPHETITT